MKKYTNKDLEKAIVFATENHTGQTRKGDGRLYIMHPFSVMSRLYKYKKSKNIILLAICALLHDVVEDTNVTIKEINQVFGSEVATIVSELTSNKAQIIFLGKKDYLRIKLNHISSYSLVIKLCDRLDNVCDLDNMSDVFKKKVYNETMYILNGLDRKLSKTHLNIINDIKKEIKQYEKL